MTSFKIILSTFLLAISYGIIHDLVTAHLCLEYFTKGHPKLIESESPILLACTWGFVATWWLALPMGLLISFFNQFGHYPPLGFTEIFHLLKNLALFMFLFVFLSGILGFLLSELNVIFLISDLSQQIHPSKHSKFLAAGFAHGSSYVSGIIGSLVICKLISSKRKNLQNLKNPATFVTLKLNKEMKIYSQSHFKDETKVVNILKNEFQHWKTIKPKFKTSSYVFRPMIVVSMLFKSSE